MKFNKINVILYVSLIISIYFLPKFIKDTGSGIFMLLILIPTVIFTISLIFSLKNNFKLYFSIIVSLLFFSTINIYYNDSALIYTFIYGIISLIGQAVGFILKKQLSIK